MASIKFDVVIPQVFEKLPARVQSAVVEGVKEVQADLLRVATERTPVKSTTLQDSGSTSKVNSTGTKIVGAVSFTAINRGYNYALKMDEGKYNLGSKSILKSKRGVRSKFAKGSLPVGSGYLSDTAKKCEKGYEDHIAEKVAQVMKESGVTAR